MLAGCGSAAHVTVEGQVQLDQQPVQRGTIAFLPADGLGPTAEAVIADGRYQLACPPGAKKVVIRGYRVTGQEHVAGPDSPLVDLFQPIIPPRYNDRTELEAAITDDRSDLDFHLESR